ncbi:transposase [uncultured Chryseobacterium sp.]|uniref:transposase n=1 Tax=uncultured Chryseobacterium sp. TaxID=259322 RepID=UPI0025DB1FF0|nr:transposase [uncultured Chryseobacterium sp.]
MINLKEISIGELIKLKVEESGITMQRICKFMKCSEDEIWTMYNKKSIDCELLMRWSKLLKYDFFRLYSQHLILFSPAQKNSGNKDKASESRLPNFRKNIYTKEIIDFILDLILSGEKTNLEINRKYEIPTTTLYKWLSKYRADR